MLLRIAMLLAQIIKLGFVVSICYSSMLDSLLNVLVLCMIHFVLMEFWRSFKRPTVIIVISMLMWLIVPPLVWPDVSYVNLLMIFIVVILALQVLRDAILLMAWAYHRPQLGWEDMSEGGEEKINAKIEAALSVIRYDEWVEYLYVNFIGHQFPGLSFSLIP